MKTTITGRHFEISDSLRQHVDDEAAKLQRFFGGIVDCSVTMSVEKHRHCAEVTVNVYEHTLRSSHESADMTLSIDKALEKVERQLKRVHDKLRQPQRVNKEDLLTSQTATEEEEDEE